MVISQANCGHFTNYYEGGTVGLLALNALFILMRDYNLFVSY